MAMAMTVRRGRVYTDSKVRLSAYLNTLPLTAKDRKTLSGLVRRMNEEQAQTALDNLGEKLEAIMQSVAESTVRALRAPTKTRNPQRKRAKKPARARKTS